jgi:hypothetical protein
MTKNYETTGCQKYNISRTEGVFDNMTNTVQLDWRKSWNEPYHIFHHFSQDLLSSISINCQKGGLNIYHIKRIKRERKFWSSRECSLRFLMLSFWPTYLVVFSSSLLSETSTFFGNGVVSSEVINVNHIFHNHDHI